MQCFLGRFYLLIVGICVTSITVSANDLGNRYLLEQANQHYKEADYSVALSLYDSLILQFEDAQLFYNAGNCHYQLNNIAETVWYYNKALKLSPKDEDIEHNLKLAELRVVSKIEPIPSIKLFETASECIKQSTIQDYRMWAIIFAIVAAILVGLGWYFRFGKLKLAVYVLIATFGFASLLSVIGSFIIKSYHQNLNEAILFTNNTYVKSAPATSAKDLFLLQEGIKLIIKDEVDGWQKIELIDGKQGWIPVGQCRAF